MIVNEPLQPNEQGGPYIFVSYSHNIKDKADEIIRILQSNGYRVWFDKGLNLGSFYNNDIASHIKNCRVFLCLLSEGYYESAYCNQEFLYATEELGKPIIPVYVGDIKEVKAELPDGINMWLTGVHSFVFKDNGVSLVKEIEMSGLVKNCRKRDFKEQTAKKEQNKNTEYITDRDLRASLKEDSAQSDKLMAMMHISKRTMIIVMLEEVLLIILLLVNSRYLQERITMVGLLCFVLIMGITIVVANIVEMLDSRIWVSYLLTSLVFFLGFFALEIFGKIPGSTGIQVILGLGYAFLHMMFSRIIGQFIR